MDVTMSDTPVKQICMTLWKDPNLTTETKFLKQKWIVQDGQLVNEDMGWERPFMYITLKKKLEEWSVYGPVVDTAYAEYMSGKGKNKEKKLAIVLLCLGRKKKFESFVLNPENIDAEALVQAKEDPILQSLVSMFEKNKDQWHTWFGEYVAQCEDILLPRL